MVIMTAETGNNIGIERSGNLENPVKDASRLIPEVAAADEGMFDRREGHDAIASNMSMLETAIGNSLGLQIASENASGLTELTEGEPFSPPQV